MALHPVCSAVKLNLTPKLEGIGKACSKLVMIPAHAGCCGFAGDRGFLFPELTEAATRREADELASEGYDAYVSSSPTCEIGMTRATGHVFRRTCTCWNMRPVLKAGRPRQQSLLRGASQVTCRCDLCHCQVFSRRILLRPVLSCTSSIVLTEVPPRVLRRWRSEMDGRLVSEFRSVVGDAGLVSGPEQLRTYECDGLTLFRVVPDLVLLPSSAQQMQAIVKICHRERIPFVARGSGTGLSGGALPVKGGVVISVSRMNHILEIDVPNARVVVEPGVTNAAITAAVSAYGYFYAPDPASQVVCTVGGNVAENSGGVHCFKYGVTTTYILGLDVVLSDGSLVHLGDKTLECPGYDLVGAFVGSEGTFGIVTKITLRIVKKPEATQTLMAAFNSISEAGAAVSAIISS